jgi:hypothetical protein
MKVFQTTYNPTTVDLTKPTSTVTPTISQATTTLLGTTPTTTAIQHTTPVLLQAVLQRQELLVGHLQLQQTHPYTNSSYIHATTTIILQQLHNLQQAGVEQVE